MPFAIIGVRRNATDDTDVAVKCMKDGFASVGEALAHAQTIRKESQNEYSELYPERYNGERWIPIGGRCHLQAYRVLTESYRNLIESGYYGDNPALVHGYCIRFKTVAGKAVPSGHAWIEGKGSILDCGSYIPKTTLHEKDEYYREKDVVKVYRYTREEAERHYRTGEQPFPWDPPPKEFARERAIWDQLQRE